MGIRHISVNIVLSEVGDIDDVTHGCNKVGKVEITNWKTKQSCLPTAKQLLIGLKAER